MSATEKWSNLKLPLTILYDSKDIRSAIDIQDLKARDQKGNIKAVDIYTPGFKPADHGLDDASAHHGLHVRDAEGKVLEGVDAEEAAYEAVGLGSYFRFNRGPGMRSGVPFGQPPR